MATKYDSFECFEYGDRNYGVTLVDSTTGAKLVTNSVACGRQAVAQVTRHGKRPMRFLGVRRMRAGEVVATGFPAECHISDPLHTHTHRFPLPA